MLPPRPLTRRACVPCRCSQVGVHDADADVGEGVRWSCDRQSARRLVGGELLEPIPLDEARKIAQDIGEPVTSRRA